MKKIDAHLHLANVVAGYCRRGESRAIGGGKAAWGNGEEFQLIPEGVGNGWNFTAEDALVWMDQNEVEKACLMQGSMYGFQNRYHIEVMKQYPDRFCGAATIDPYMTNHMDDLAYLIEDQDMPFVKFEISSGGGLMGCHDPIDLSGDRMMEIYRLIEKNGKIVTLDVGDMRMESHQPYALMRVSDRCPDLKIVICHMMAPDRALHKEWLLELQLLSRANVWFDFAAMPKIMAPDAYPYPETVAYLREAADILGSDRMMWGTDAPFAATQDTYEHLADYLLTIDDCPFTQAELEDLYYNNANNLYFGGK